MFLMTATIFELNKITLIYTDVSTNAMTGVRAYYDFIYACAEVYNYFLQICYSDLSLMCIISSQVHHINKYTLVLQSIYVCIIRIELFAITYFCVIFIIKRKIKGSK